VGRFDRVVADAAHRSLPDVDVEDVVQFLSRQGSVPGVYSLNQFQAPNEVTISVVCEEGIARFEYHNARWRWMKRPDEPWMEEPAAGLERDTLFTKQANRFLDAIKRGTPPLCNFAEGEATLRVNLALVRSIQSGKWQEIS
jgi:predicted dehydrogenase